MSTLPPDSAPQPAPVAGTDHDALPPGTRFGEFEILRVLGVGGFGIVYLAHDHSLEREVALKEYMPASLAARGAGPQITVRSSSFAETYAIGLRSFVNEARLLARFDHPSLVKVYRFWEDNATAYMVMPYLQGVTLRDTRRRMAHPPDESWIRSVITPILAALELLHREGVYHRDIAPDNILLQHEGPPILLDFGAARRVISDRTQSLTAILKPSYAPIEQYAEMTQLRQGPWTDLYALGAVIHYLLFGAPPAPATARAVQDDAEAIENRIVPGVSPRFLEAVSWMLSVRPNQRPQSGEQLRTVLDGHAQVPPRGRPGITIPPNVALPGVPPASAHPPSQPPGPTHRPQVETASDATQVNTAHMPTFLPTAQVPAPGQTRPPPATTFSPTAPMPTARPPQQTTEFDSSLAQRAAAPHARTQAPPMPPMPPAAVPRADAGASQWPASRPGTLPPPLPPQSRPAPPMAGPSHEPARSRPAPLPSAAAIPAAKTGGNRAGLIVAGVVGVLVVAAAAAWQFSAKDPGTVDATAGTTRTPSTSSTTGTPSTRSATSTTSTTSTTPAPRCRRPAWSSRHPCPPRPCPRRASRLRWRRLR
jgi:serine/threonine protein kinase